MLIIDERVAATIQNPATDKKVLFNDAADGLLKTKDSAGVLETLATTEGLAAAAEATEPKVYIALLTQTGVLAPVATVIKNTLGGTVVWTYVDVGRYTGTLASAFTENKTFCISHVANQETADITTSFGRITSNTVGLQVLIPSFGFSDVFSNLQVRIEVHP